MPRFRQRLIPPPLPWCRWFSQKYSKSVCRGQRERCSLMISAVFVCQNSTMVVTTRNGNVVIFLLWGREHLRCCAHKSLSPVMQFTQFSIDVLDIHAQIDFKRLLHHFLLRLVQAQLHPQHPLSDRQQACSLAHFRFSTNCVQEDKTSHAIDD